MLNLLCLLHNLLNIVLSVKSSVSDDPLRVSSENLECTKVVLHSNSDDKVENLSLVVYSADVARSAIPGVPVSDAAKSLDEGCPVNVSPKVSSEIEPARPSSPHSSNQLDGVPVYTSTSLAERLDHIRHFAGLPSTSVPEPYKVIHPDDPSVQTDIDDEKILAEVYGPQAQLSVPLTMEATAHPDSTSFKIREVSKLLGTSSAPVSETSHSVSPSPTDHSPSRETRKSKCKGIPERVAVETGDDNLDTVQPKKRRRSAETVKAESDPPVQQVFKTLRSSVKNKAPAVNSTTSTRKMKPTTRSRGRSVTPNVQTASDSPDTSIYTPQFVSATAQGKWSTMVRQELIVQRSVDENQLNSVCDILPLLSEVGLMKTVTSIFPYSMLLTYEFYCNLNEEIDNLTGTRCMQIFIRGKWYVLDPDVINEYYGLKAVDEEEITDWDLVARTLTSGQTPIWPTGDVDTLSSSKLTSRYVILHRIALHNWLPSVHFNTVGKQLADLLFRISTRMTIDLGKWIFYHFLTLIHPREQKVRLPYPNLIFGVLTTQGLVPMPSEIICPTFLYTVDPRLLTGKHIRDVTPVAAPPSSDADTPVDDSPHARDIQLSLQLKARVSELETVNGIIAKQLTAARTELATVLLRLSLTESAATENEKSDSDAPSNAL
ncbi:PREDICTED: uncharacterized protein LOC109160642 [Ipomoea nil]|uniref:uncharacterized protein LOC109160642 n=1 Tax=Ipomoea nil TaxID=35883 RepID=UPI000901C1B3|nr:PREDICTED: uncharacterized protein LOC109160642 [Ipomoea nil]